MKLIIAGALLLAVSLATWYVQGLRGENDRLQLANQQLQLTMAANIAVVHGLQAQREIDAELLQQWGNHRQQLMRLQNQLDQQIQKELQTNENFKMWSGDTLPDSALRMLQSTDAN